MSTTSWSGRRCRWGAADQGGDLPATATARAAHTESALPVVPVRCTIVVTDPARRPVAAGAPAVTGTRGTVALGRLPGNGTYTVAYRVVSVDGHPVQGSYPFTLAVPDAPAAPVAAVTPPGAGRADGTPAGTRGVPGPRRRARGPGRRLSPLATAPPRRRIVHRMADLAVRPERAPLRPHRCAPARPGRPGCREPPRMSSRQRPLPSS
ncbi:copper resistance CopC family protein [Micromonospora sp. NPDC049559]|uniref:copper resistance CopC family protein n=1 Tax=Micromonospora sp. NPDC049559 TaxID=3155923 RepID=UPI003431E374